MVIIVVVSVIGTIEVMEVVVSIEVNSVAKSVLVETSNSDEMLVAVKK